MASSTPSIAPSVDTYRIPRTSPWAKAWQTTAALSAVGALLCIFAYFGDSARTQFSYLFAFVCGLALALGSLFFVIVQHLTGAGWSVTLRRTAELYASGIWVFPILFLPILAGVVSGSSALYPWLHVSPEGESGHHDPAAQGEHHSALPGLFESTAVAQHDDHQADAAAHHTPQHQAHEDVIRAKLGYLRGPSWMLPQFAGFFALRAFLYFVVWLSIVRFFFRHSTTQDRTRDIGITKKMQARAAMCMIGFALSLTFAAFDWMMSLEPTWFSTIFGVQYFTVGAVVALATLVVTTLAFSESGLTGKAIHHQHFHDVGKLLFGFMVFWAYISFSQYMLIWYASIPEETTYYHLRWHGGWKLFSVALLIAHFFFPFFLLMSRNAKLNTNFLKFGATWLIGTHIFECYWLVMPYANGGELRFHWVDIAALLCVVGAYLSVVFFNMTRYPLIPVGDPRVTRAMNHEVA